MVHCDLILAVAFELLEHRRLTASALSEKFGVAPRTIYRYIERLTPFLPLHIVRGRRGGIYLADNYRLPERYFTEGEYRALDRALTAAYQLDPDEELLAVKRKLTRTRTAKESVAVRAEAGEVVVAPTTDREGYAKLQAISRALKGKTLLSIVRKQGGEAELVEPYLLLLIENAWELFAYDYATRSFLRLPLVDMAGVLQTDAPFRPRPFEPPIL